MLEHETESGSNTSLLLSQNPPSTLCHRLWEETQSCCCHNGHGHGHSREVRQARLQQKKTTKQSTTMRKPVRNKERKTSSTLGLSIVCGKSGIQKRKQKKVKNWKERKVHVDHNQFTIKELWERKSIELRNDQLCSLFNENMSRREAHCSLKIFL